MIKKLAIISLLLVGCSKENKELAETTEETPFNLVDASISGLDFANDLEPDGNLNIIEYLYYYNGAGVALGDINNDGLDDIFLTANQKTDKLYLNQGNLKFKDISNEANISKDSTWSTGVTMADINNDGYLDIYVCKVGNYKGLKAKNELYINQGNNTFKEQASDFGLDFSGFSTQATFFDYDKDGDLDMYLLNHSVHTPHSYGNSRLRNNSDELAGDVLFENKLETGKLSFIDVTEQAGIYNSSLGYGLAITISDINNDGYQDIYIGNDFHENDYLYINNKNKTFTESSEKLFSHTSRFTMGVDIADLNNDCRLDIFTLDMMPNNAEIFLKSGGEDSDKVNQIKEAFGYHQQYARNNFQLNTETGFKEIALISNTYATDWSWSPLIFDYNNDGLNDIYITNGIYKRPNDLDYVNYLSTVDFAKYEATKQDEIEDKLINMIPTLNLPNILFKNEGELKFKQTVANYEPSFSNGAAYSDLDNDGDLDLVVNNLNQKVSLLENKSNVNNYLSVNLLEKQNSLNTDGAKVYLYSNNKTLIREQTATRGFLSSSSRKLHFGLGNIEEIDSLKVVWNDGTYSLLKNIEVNNTINISKQSNINNKYHYANGEDATLQPFDFYHLENSFLDYDREGLIPEKLSLEGPSTVAADFNKDGLTDLFIGGARNQAPKLYFQNKEGTFNVIDNEVFTKDSSYEDVDAIAFDIDGDNDLDIYALSGGNDFLEGDPMLEDRVYINDGNGNFTKLHSNLLATNGGSVSSYDFNKDGLEDLFIGNRSIPSAYGLSPYSYILKNVGNNNFEIVTRTRIGMITDSKWADLNNDGEIELIIAGDWMPITVLSYTSDNKFENKTDDYNLSNLKGFWNTIHIVDVNNDGQLDILAGNAGENFKWKASIERPIKMHLGDFDKNQKIDQLIFYDFFGKYVPFASKDKLIQQLPFLKKEFLNYNTFSKVSNVSDLIKKATDDILETKEITELKSLALINDSGKFKKQPLPFQAQLSTIEDFISFNNKIVYTGNYFGYVTELGNSSANPGGVLSFTNSDKIKHDSFLKLPSDFSGRKLIKLNNQIILAIGNNGRSYLIDVSTISNN